LNLATLVSQILAIPAAFAHPGHDHSTALGSGPLHGITGFDYALILLTIALAAGALIGGKGVVLRIMQDLRKKHPPR